MKEFFKKHRNKFLVIGVNLVLITIVLYAFEFLFSPYRKIPTNGMKGGKRYTWGHEVINNELGFRERNIEKKSAGVFRVMVLGDSLTWGAGLALAERYSDLTELKLNKSDKYPGKKFEVFNFGMQGGPTVKERDILKTHFDKVQPNLIVVGFCINDPQPKGQNFSTEREIITKSILGRINYITARVLRMAGLKYVSQIQYGALYKLHEKMGHLPSWRVALDRTYEKESKEWQAFLKALDDIKNISDKAGLPTPIFACLNQSGASAEYKAPNEHLRQLISWYDQAGEAAQGIGFNSYDHIEEIKRDLIDKPYDVNPMDGHPSKELNVIYADKLTAAILKVISKSDLEKEK